MSWVAFDIETTGLSTTSCDIVQFAYIMFDSSNQFVKAENLYFYYEGMSWSQEAADKSHHLTLEFLKQYEDKFEENLLKMYSVLNRANVCGYNSNHFDCPFVKNWLSRHGLSDFEFGVQQDCMIALRPISKKARYKLVNMVKLFDLTESTIEYCTNIWFSSAGYKSAHDAMYDTTSTALLALQALAKGYITFDYTKLTPVQTSEDDFDMVDDEHDLPIYEHSFAIEDINGVRSFNPDHSLYRTTDGEGLWKIPVVFNSTVGSDRYDAEVKGCTLYWEPSGDKEVFGVITPYISVTSETTNVLPLIQSLFKEG